MNDKECWEKNLNINNKNDVLAMLQLLRYNINFTFKKKQKLPIFWERNQSKTKYSALL